VVTDQTGDGVDAILAEVQLFADLPTPARAAIARAALSVELRAGEWLFRRGDPGDALFVVLRGRVEVVAEADAGSMVVRTLDRGGVLGELGLLTRASRSASVRARRDSALLEIRRDRLPMGGTESRAGCSDHPARAP
jgi:CRP-like cAMP-binding protein